jgi:hypothetical protein
VRKTTEVFASSADADIPPVLIGQSWLDFPVIGALLWGLFIGLQSRAFSHLSERLTQSPNKIALTVLASMIIALPINSGSLDFTFSTDIIILTLLLGLVFHPQNLISYHQRESNP